MRSVVDDPYKTLGVSRTASEDDIKQAYRKLAQKLHPDRNPDKPKIALRFKEINAAYEVLGDVEKRKLFDEFGPAALQSGFNAEQARKLKSAYYGGGPGGGPQGFEGAEGFENLGGGFQDVFSQLFSGATRGARPQRGSDLHVAAEIDFMTAFKGGAVTLHLESAHAGKEPIEVKIPPGLRDGQKIRLAGLGAPGSLGGPRGAPSRGDLVVQVAVAEHPVFHREGDDIHSEVPVTIREAIEGSKILVDTPDGRVEVNVPPRTQSGRKLRLRGLGAPKKEGGKGDIFIQLRVQVPDLDDPHLIELAREMDRFYKNPLRGP